MGRMGPRGRQSITIALLLAAVTLLPACKKELVDAMAVAIPALKKLNAVSEAKFGAEARQLVEDPYLVNGVPALQEANLTGDDKRARLVNKDQRLLSVLTHVDGVWKVDVGASIAGRDITSEIPELNALGKICNELIGQIESGKLKTAADAKRELQMLILIEVRGQAATAPSSAPSTTQASAPPAP